MPANAAKHHPNGTTATQPGREATVKRANGNKAAHDRVAGIQRARMLAATVQAASDRGAGDVTVAEVVQRAGVSRRTFYEAFDDCEHCLLAAFDDGIERAAEHVVSAYRAPGRWPERIRRALAAMLWIFDRDLPLARFLVVESLAIGRPCVERRALVLNQLVHAVDAGRAEARTGTSATSLIAEGVVGAVLGVIHGRLSEPDPGELIELLNPLMSMVVLPYLGPAAARRESERELPVSDPTHPAGRTSGNALRQLEMRLTYRTVQVLQAVALQPGSSNRSIGDSSGISDQGQISKLLARLERLGLIENRGSGSVRGEPNAWTLTARGEEVHGALAAHASGRA